MGTPPAWEDILCNLDAPRQINDALHAALTDTTKPHPLVYVHGSAGCGKSTVVKRVALKLAQSGVPCLFAEGDVFPPVAEVAEYLTEHVKARAVLFVDNAGLISSGVRDLVRSLQGIAEDKRPSIVLVARTNDLDRWRDGLLAVDPTIDLQVPHLEDQDIQPLIGLLEKHGLLGKLEGKPMNEQIAAFRLRARRQLLVAMKEATQGRGFDQIIDDEFDSLPDNETKIVYLVGALATAAEFRLTRDELIGASSGPLNTALERIDRRLAGILVPWDSERNTYVLRHRIIADRVLESSAPRGLLREAYERIIRVLALDLGTKPVRRSRTFRLYRALINHKPMFRRFDRAIGEARSVYDAINPLVDHDYHFWLQYGLLELENGSLSLAAPYLASAEAIAGDDDFVTTAVAHLRLRQAIDATSITEAVDLRAEGEAALRQLVRSRGDYDARVHHVLVSQLFGWVNKWCRQDPKRRATELKEVLELADRAVAKHGHSLEVRQLRDDVKAAFLQAAIL